MHSLYKQNNLPYLNVKLCPNCKKLVPVGDGICPHCNYNFTSKISAKDLFVEEEAVKEVPVVKEQPKQEEKVVSKPVSNTKVVFCDNCGAKIIGPQKYCGGCGAKVSKRICPSCDQIIDAHLSFCPLCGEKLNDPIPKQTLQEAVVEQPKTATNVYSGQPINIYLNQSEKPTTIVGNQVQTEEEKVEEAIQQVEQTNDDEVVVATEEETPVVEAEEKDNTPLKEVVNMGRKRLFIIMQLIVVALIAAIMVVVPILTSDFFITEMVDCFKGTSNEPLMTFKDLFAYFTDTVNFKIFEVKPSIIRPMLSSGNVNLIFSDISFLAPLFEKIPTEDQTHLMLQISYCSMLTTYGCIILSIIVVFFTSLFGLFIRKPMKGKAMGFTTIMLFICSAVVFALNVYFNDFENYDSWLTYAFLLSFVMWMIIKLVFLKENRRYKKIKNQLYNDYEEQAEDDDDDALDY